MRRTIALLLGAAALLTTTPLAAAPHAAERTGEQSVVKPGIDFVYIDPQLDTLARAPRQARRLQHISSRSDAGSESAPNLMFAALRQGLERYQSTWGSLSQVQISRGPVLKLGSTGRQVALLRTRLGLPAAARYDEQLAQRVSEYQRVHGLGTPDGVAGKSTIDSLNLGAEYYSRRIAINMERAQRLPAANTFDRYVLVNSANPHAYLVDHDRVVDQMRVVVGMAKSKTPMMALLMRNAKANPYWNVPLDLIRTMIAKRVLDQGITYLEQFHYQVLSDWTPSGHLLDPSTIDWQKVAAGESDIYVRQLPGPWNAMGQMKFEMPNQYGIYIHDTPDKKLMAQEDRWRSNGCVRLEDHHRFATWVFDRVPQPTSVAEQPFELSKPVPIYITYLTVEPTDSGVIFRPDLYGNDAVAMPSQTSGAQIRLASTS